MTPKRISQHRNRSPKRRKLPAIVALFAATIASGICYAAFNIDPALLAEAKARAAEVLPSDLSASAIAVSAPIGDRLAEAKHEMEVALQEREAAWAAVRAATARVDAAKRELAAARDAGGAADGVPRATATVVAARGEESHSRGAYERGTATLRQPVFVLPRGEYSRAKFFATVLPPGYVTQPMHSGDLDRIVVSDDFARTWVQWLDFVGKQTNSVVTVSHRTGKVTFAAANETYRVASRN